MFNFKISIRYYTGQLMQCLALGIAFQGSEPMVNKNRSISVGSSNRLSPQNFIECAETKAYAE